MTRFKSQGFNNTFKNARKGFRLVLKSEKNIRVHIVIAFLVMIAAYFLEFSALEFCVALFAISMVIVAEMLNTAIEFALDSIYHNRYSRMVGMAKDISAGAVINIAQTSFSPTMYFTSILPSTISSMDSSSTVP